MSQKSRSDFFKMIQHHYHRTTDLKGKGALLDSAQKALGVGRKYLIRKLGAPTDSRPPRKRTGRPVTYHADLVGALKALWLAEDQPCGKLLHAGMKFWIPSWELRHGVFSEELRAELVRISPAHIDRLLKAARVAHGAQKRRCEANEVRQQVPIRQGPWDVSGPGWFEADTVFHSGGDPKGCFVRSLCITDIYSGWTEVRATWNQSHLKVHERLREIEVGLPFAMLGYDVDNGTEVLNTAILSYFRAREVPIDVTRSRPYHSNDNAHVEQKNRTHVREFIGYERIGDIELVEPFNAALEAWSLWRNLYRPSMKLLSKERKGSRVVKKYEEQPLTAAQRVLAHPKTSEATRDKIEMLLARHDPLMLKDVFEGHLKRFVVVQNRLRGEQENGAGARPSEYVSIPAGSGGGGLDSLRSPNPPPPTPFGIPTYSEPSREKSVGSGVLHL